MDDQDEPKIVDERVDLVIPEGGLGQDAANFSAKIQQEQKLSGASAEAPKPQTKESEWPMGVRKSAEVNGKRWEYLEYGNPDGEPVLNIHGWLGSSAAGNERLSLALAGQVMDSPGMQSLDQDLPKGAQKVKGLVAGMRGKYHIIAPELPGFGKSEDINDPTVDNMADALADFQKAIVKKPAVLFGSSAGAVLTTKMAARHPEAVNALVLQGMMTRPEDMQKLAYVAASVVTFKPIARLLEMFPNFSREKLFPAMVTGSKDFKNADAATQKLILDSAKVAHVPTALDTLRDIGKNIEEEVAKVQAPTVVLDGASGDLVPIETSKKNAGKFHPEAGANLQEKIAERKVIYFQVGGVAGEHTHNVINTAPEEVAVLINHAVEYFKTERPVKEQSALAPEPPAAVPTVSEQSRLARVRSRLAAFARVGR